MGQSVEMSREQLLEVAENVDALRGEQVVIKVGGDLIADNQQKDILAEDIDILGGFGIYPIIVHGGGPQIDSKLNKHGLRREKIDGVRKTPQGSVPHVIEALDEVNKELVAAINKKAGGDLAVGVNDYVFTAELAGFDDFGSSKNVKVTHSLVEEITKDSKVAVVNCAGRLCTAQTIELARKGLLDESCEENPRVNINADASAGALAKHLEVYKYVSLTKAGAVLDGQGERINRITPESAKALIESGVISEGMIPKVLHAVDLLPYVGSVAISSPENTIHELFTHDGAGTLIKE